MKPLREFDFLAPATRPWAGYLLLTLAGATLFSLAWILWQTRTVDGMDASLRPASGRNAELTGRPGQPQTPLFVSRPAMSVAPGATGMSASAPPSTGMAAASAATTPGATPAGASPASAGSTSDSTTLAAVAPIPATVHSLLPAGPTPASDLDQREAERREAFQLRRTRAVGGPQALPWVELLQVIQSHQRPGITLLAMEPEVIGRPGPSRVRLNARASDEARLRTFVDALQADARMHEVSYASPLQPADPTPSAASSADLRGTSASASGTPANFTLLLSLRSLAEVRQDRSSPGSAPSGVAGTVRAASAELRR